MPLDMEVRWANGSGLCSGCPFSACLTGERVSDRAGRGSRVCAGVSSPPLCPPIISSPPSPSSLRLTMCDASAPPMRSARVGHSGAVIYGHHRNAAEGLSAGPQKAKGRFEVGAQWIQGPSPENPVFQLAAQYGLLSAEALLEENQKLEKSIHFFRSSLSAFYISSGKKIEQEQLTSVQKLYVEWFQKSTNVTKNGCGPEDSLGRYLRQELERDSKDWDKETSELNQAILQWFHNLECLLTGSNSLDDVEFCSFEEYDIFPGLDCTFPKGHEGFVNRMKEDLPPDSVILNKAVKKITWNGAFRDQDSRVYPVEVQCEDGDTFVADHVIVTVPLGFLKKHVEDFVSPSLPANKIKAIQNLGFGTMNKIILELEQPIWDTKNATHINLVWEGASQLKEPEKDMQKNWMKKIVCFVVLQPPEQLGNVIVGFIPGKEAEYLETLSDEEVLSAMTDLLRQFTGNPDLPPPISIMRSKWHSEPYTAGTYSYVAVGSTGKDIDVLAEPVPSDKDSTKPLQLLFAGEATERTYYATTHGALISAWREAQRLITHHPELNAKTNNNKL